MGPYLDQAHLGALALSAPPQDLAVGHQDPFPFQLRLWEDGGQGLGQGLGVQAVEELGEGGVAWGFPQAQVGEEVGVGAGEAGDAAQGVHAGEEGQQDEGQEAPEGVAAVVGAGVGNLG